MKKAGTFFSKVRSLCREYIKTSLKGWLIFFSMLGVASAICAMLMRTTTSDVHVPLIFVLAVLIISLSTDGYFYGFLAAFVSGCLACKIMISLVRRGKLIYFAAYCAIAGLLSLIFLA